MSEKYTVYLKSKNTTNILFYFIKDYVLLTMLQYNICFIYI